MRILLLLAILAGSLNVTAQSDSTSIAGAPLAPDSLLLLPADTVEKVVCTDTIRLGNMYVSGALGTRVSYHKIYSGIGGQGKVTTWGRNYVIGIGYKTLNERFLVETGYMVRELQTATRFHYVYSDLDLIFSSEMKQVPLYLKTRVLNKASGKVQLRIITGLNFTWIDEKDFELTGGYEEIAREGRLLTVRTKKPYYAEEIFIIDRNTGTGKNNTNLHLTAEIGTEASYKLTKHLEAGAAIAYQYSPGPFERLNIDFIGNERMDDYHAAFNNPATTLNLALFLRYNFDKITLLKCEKAKKN
ncbi:hypothetical protein [Adhaeribacter terreus]|uniref:Outer membrane protein beta-barrel domain-containing protein n=1 Tax=Adhaeribacter terreus TaxID=529703 RepID=A0ABW0EFC1_9BACT